MKRQNTKSVKAGCFALIFNKTLFAPVPWHSQLCWMWGFIMDTVCSDFSKETPPLSLCSLIFVFDKKLFLLSINSSNFIWYGTREKFGSQYIQSLWRSTKFYKIFPPTASSMYCKSIYPTSIYGIFICTCACDFFKCEKEEKNCKIFSTINPKF